MLTAGQCGYVYLLRHDVNSRAAWLWYLLRHDVDSRAVWLCVPVET